MPKTLLLADDSVTIQKVVGISFASEDIEIVTVDNGDAAVAKAREIRPDIVLADVVMPGLSGYEVCEALKADAALRDVPVVLLTGTFEAFDEERAQRAGAAAHVAKPFEAQTLVDRVKELLAAPAPAAEPVPAVEPPAAAAPEAADAFDFFDGDDTADDLSDAADFSNESDTETDLADSLDFDEPESAFAFGDDDLASVTPEPQPAPPLEPATPAAPAHDATVAILPEPFDAPSPSVGDDFEFDAPGDPPAAVDEDAARGGTLFEPSGSSFDVSSSDLAADAPALTQVMPPAPDTAATDPLAGSDEDFALPEPGAANEPAAALPPDPVFDLLRGAPSEVGADLDAGADPEEAEEADTSEPPRPFGAEPAPEPPLLEPEALEELEPEPLSAEPAPAGAVTEMTPAMRQELRDTLEKITWDALAPVTEKVVRQAIEQIEKVAWEVVPKLAETLIQEEIRRLKEGRGEE